MRKKKGEVTKKSELSGENLKVGFLFELVKKGVFAVVEANKILGKSWGNFVA